MEINSYELHEQVNLAALGASGPIGTAAATVDIASHVGVTATAQGLTFTIPVPTDSRSGRTLRITNKGTIPFTVAGVQMAASDYSVFLFDAGVWHTPQSPSVRKEFDLQEMLQLNGTAKVSLNGEVRWTNRFIVMTAGITPQEVSGYHDISIPADGATVPVQGGGTRTILAPTAGQSGATGGIPLNAWETLWYRIVRGSSNGSVATNFLITPYTANATSSVPGILNDASYPGTNPGEWVRIVSRDDGDKFKWGTGDVVGRGGQFGGGHDLTIAHWTAMKARVQLGGYAYATFATATPQRFGMTGSIRWIDAGITANINSQGFVDSSQVGRAAGIAVIGVNGAATRAWETVTAADAIAKFGGALRGTDAITAASTVVQINDNETLYYAPDLPNSTPVNGGTWYIAGYSGAVSIPIHWLPVASYQVTGAQGTLQVLLGGVQRSLRAGDAVFFGKSDGDIDRLHRRMGVTHTGLKYTRWTHAGYFAGAAANGLLQDAEGVMVSWDANQMMYGISDGYASWGNQYTYINIPAAGTAIPLAYVNGAVAITRVVENISGRPYVPLGRFESLWFIPSAYAAGGGSVNGDFVITYYGTNHTVPAGAVRVAHFNGSRGLTGTADGKARVAWADGTVTQPGLTYSSATPALRVQNDHAQGTGDWRALVYPGQTGPGMTAALPATVGVLGGYAAPYTAFYNYRTSTDDPRGNIHLEGLINLNASITGTQRLAFLPGVNVRGEPIVNVPIQHSTGGDQKMVNGQIRFQNIVLNGSSGVQIMAYLDSFNTAVNPYFTLGTSGNAVAPGIPNWVSLSNIVLPHA